MTIRLILMALAATCSAPTLAQASPAESPAAAVAQEDIVRVALETPQGRIVLALDRGRAPLTTANFLRYVDAKRFDSESIYRAMQVGDGGGLIQGGIRSDSRKLYPPVAHEPTTQTGLKHVAGAIALANGGAGTARADFFILTTDIPSFDASGTDPGFAVFGRVVEGMDVVSAILAAPVSPDKGDGPMKGQMLDPAVRIIKAVRLK